MSNACDSDLPRLAIIDGLNDAERSHSKSICRLCTNQFGAGRWDSRSPDTPGAQARRTARPPGRHPALHRFPRCPRLDIHRQTNSERIQPPLPRIFAPRVPIRRAAVLRLTPPLVLGALLTVQNAYTPEAFICASATRAISHPPADPNETAPPADAGATSAHPHRHAHCAPGPRFAFSTPGSHPTTEGTGGGPGLVASIGPCLPNSAWRRRGCYWQLFFMSRSGCRMPSRSDLVWGLLAR
jgi:hypothetical protein